MYSSFLPGTDNLFKYILTIGFILLFFAVVYPLQKKQELKIEELDLLMKAEGLNYEIRTLGAEVDKLRKDKNAADIAIKRFNQELITASHNDSILIQNEIKKLQVAVPTDQITKKSQDLKKKVIESNYEIKKHKEISKQIESYFIFQVLFLGGGIIFIILGFRFWLSVTYLEESDKCRNANPPYTTSFLRVRLRIRRFLKFP